MDGRDDRITQRRIADGDRVAIQAAAQRVFRNDPWIDAAYLYGSAARSDRPARDVDIGLVGDPSAVSWDAPARLASSLAAESGISEIPFDVRLLVGASPVLLANVLREGERIYDANPEARIAFEARAMSEWLDWKPAYERVRSAVLRRWAHG